MGPHSDGSRPDDDTARWFRRLLAATGCRLVELDPDHHDRLTASIQVATHAAILAFGATRAELGYDPAVALLLASPPHRTLLALLARIVIGEPHVYHDIQHAHPLARSTREATARALERLNRAAAPAEPDSFAALGAELAAMLEPHRAGFELFLTQLIAEKISGPSPSLCRISFDEIDGRDVCRIDVAASARPVFARPLNTKDHTDFWIRQGNRTAQFHGTEQVEYVDGHRG